MVFPKTIKTRFLPGPGVRGKNERSCVRAQRAWEQRRHSTRSYKGGGEKSGALETLTTARST